MDWMATAYSRVGRFSTRPGAHQSTSLPRVPNAQPPYRPCSRRAAVSSLRQAHIRVLLMNSSHSVASAVSKKPLEYLAPRLKYLRARSRSTHDSACRSLKVLRPVKAVSAPLTLQYQPRLQPNQWRTPECRIKSGEA